MILKFNKNIYDDSEWKPCHPGSRKAYDIFETVDTNGNKCLGKDEYDLQEVIESYADACSIERIAIAHGLGDDSILNSKPGVYLDEDEYNAVILGQESTAQVNAQILNLYQAYKDRMSYDDFYQNLVSGNFKAFEKKPEEVNQ